MKLLLSKIAHVVGGLLIGEDCECSVISTDTRTLKSGALFVALKGENFNGEAFIERAFENGAVGAVVTKQQPDLSGAQIIVSDATQAYADIAHYYRQSLNAKIIAITGSCGKTSVKGMLKCICELSGSTSATQANFNNHIGVPMTLLACAHDDEFMIVETGTGAKGEIAYLTEIIDPDIACVINIHPAHIQHFGTLDAIAWEKSDIYFRGKRTAVSIVNQELLKYQGIATNCNAENQIIFSASEPSENKAVHDSNAIDLWAGEITINADGAAEFVLHLLGESRKVVLNIPGRHQVENALAAAACAHALDISIDTIAQGLSAYSGEKGRMQIAQLKQGKLIDDSYNANPASMKAAINALSEYSDSVLVLGDMGELGAIAEEAHQQIGSHAADKNIKELICVGAFADDYLDGYRSAGGLNTQKFMSQEELVAYLLERMGDNTVILVKGSRFTKMDRVSDSLIQLGGVA